MELLARRGILVRLFAELDSLRFGLPAGKRLVFRPQHAVLSAAEGAALRGPVTHREFLGATVRYGVRIGSSEILVETPTKLTKAQREILEQFRATETGDECPESRGFLDRLKEAFGG
mgnify:CR=1 FL=1